MSTARPCDQFYKSLFSDPSMVTDLLQGYFSQAWIKDLDFSTLTGFSTEFITEHLEKRYGDVIWKIKFKNKWALCLFIVGNAI